MKKGTFLLLVILSAFSSKATHVMGSDLFWESLGNDSFKVTIDIYRDCNGCDVPPCQIPSLSVTTNCGSRTYNTTKSGGLDITPVCDEQCTRCTSRGCSFKFGIMLYHFSTIVVVSDWRKNGCCEAKLSWSSCCRNGAITTGSSNQGFYTEGEMNICLSLGDNSPKYEVPPMSILCLGRDVIMDPFVYDGDIDSNGKKLDSLVFSMAEPLVSVTGKTSWSGSYTYQLPIYYLGFPKTNLRFPRGFNLDSSSGLLMFRPMKVEQTVMTIKVEQYRNGKFIGFTRREHQVIVIKCPDNNPPVVSGLNCSSPNLKNLEITGCIGDSISFEICTGDKDKDDTVTISASQIPDGAKFEVIDPYSKRQKGKLTWVLDSAAIFKSPHRFVFRAEDNSCPVTGIGDNGIKVFIKNKDTADIEIKSSYNDSACGSINLFYDVYDSILPSKSYWFLNDTLVNETDSFSYTFSSVDTQFVKLIVKREACFYSFFDTIIPKKFKPIEIKSVTNTAFCEGMSFVDTIRAKGGNGPLTISWIYQVNGTTLAAGSNSKIQFKTKYGNSSRLIINVLDSAGCCRMHWVDVQVKPSNYNVDIANDTSLCTSDTFSLLLPNDTAINGNWYYENIRLGRRFESNNYKPGVHELIYVKKQGSVCRAENLTVAFTAKPKLVVDSIINICLTHDRYPLKSNYQNTYWKGDYVRNDSFFYYTSTKKSTHLLEATYTSVAGCVDTAYSLLHVGTDTSTFYVNKNWEICHNNEDSVIKFKNHLYGKFINGADLFYDTLGQTYINRSKLKSGMQYATYEGVTPNYCKSKRFLSVLLKDEPQFLSIQFENSICLGADSVRLNADPSPYKWVGKGVFNTGNDYYIDLSKSSIGEQINVKGNFWEDGCWGTDSAAFNVKDTIQSNQTLPKQVCAGDTIALKRANKLGNWVEATSWRNIYNVKPYVGNFQDSFELNFIYWISKSNREKYCVLIDTIKAMQIPYPKKRGFTDTPVCRLDTLIRLEGKYPFTQWTGNNVIEQKKEYYFNPYLGNGTEYPTASYGKNKQCVRKDSQEFTIVDLPIPDAGKDTSFCLNKDIIFYNFNNQKGKWKGENIIGTSTARYMVNDTSGVYTYVLVEENSLGCKATDSMEVALGRLPKFPFKMDVDSGESPLKVSFTSNFKNAGKYIWFFGTGDSIANAFNPVYTYTQAGTYSVGVKGTDSLGVCANEYFRENSIQVFYPIGINAINNGSLLLYPNPSNETFTLVANAAEIEILGLRVYNASGKEVVNLKAINKTNSFGEDLMPGVYLLKIELSNGSVVNTRVVKN